MNKTIIININGFVFHIEEDAYEILQGYMTDVKRHFANEEDSIEITTDIENRIAEMFNEALARDNKQVIVTADVTAIISQMGTIEDFETEAEPAGSYNSRSFTGSRKLFRDQDDHLLGGVCAGIANYFDVDTIWIRLAFGLFTFLGGSGVIAYIILWIIVPKAITRADKMAMKGERLDLKGFVKNFEDEVKNVHHSLSNAGHHAKPVAYKIRDFVGDFFEHLRYFIAGAGRIILKFIGVIILMVCFSVAVSAVVALTFFTAQGRDVFHLFPFSMINHGYSDIIVFSTFAVITVPLLAIILFTLKAIFNSRVMGRSTGFTMLIIWIMALSLLGYYSFKIAADFKEEASFSQTINIKPVANHTYYLKLNDVKYLSREDSIQLNINDKFKGRIILNDDDDDNHNEGKPQSVDIYVERSDVEQPVLVESFSARGYSKKDALANSMNTSYFFSQKDTALMFDRALKIPFNTLWRGQEVKLTLKLPLKSVVIIDRAMDRFVKNASIWDCNQANDRDEHLPATFTMTTNGLECKVDTTRVRPAEAKPDKESQ